MCKVSIFETNYIKRDFSTSWTYLLLEILQPFYKISSKVLFSDTKGFRVFEAVMSRDIFKFLLSKTTLDDRRSRPEVLHSDRFVAFRKFYKKYNDSCSRYLTSVQFISIYKTPYLMRQEQLSVNVILTSLPNIAFYSNL